MEKPQRKLFHEYFIAYKKPVIAMTCLFILGAVINLISFFPLHKKLFFLKKKKKKIIGKKTPPITSSCQISPLIPKSPTLNPNDLERIKILRHSAKKITRDFRDSSQEKQKILIDINFLQTIMQKSIVLGKEEFILLIEMNREGLKNLYYDIMIFL